MVALVVVLTAMVLLLGVLVVGLLRSHADIIRALHSMGVGVGDPSAPLVGASAGVETPVPLRMGPALPAERSSSSVHDLEGVDPSGQAVVASVSSSAHTLLAFLSSGCASCATFWSALADPSQRAALPPAVRIVVVTKGPEYESPDAIATQAPPGITVVMSTAAWADYEVPGSPFFVLVDGVAGRRLGEGVAQGLPQVADLVRRADLDARAPATSGVASPGAGVPGVGGRPGEGPAFGPNGAERERANDQQLRDAGIQPGHPSLYPQGLEDVFASTAGLAGPAGPSQSGGR